MSEVKNSFTKKQIAVEREWVETKLKALSDGEYLAVWRECGDEGIVATHARPVASVEEAQRIPMRDRGVTRRNMRVYGAKGVTIL